jgi:hypothetical protein
MRYRPVAPADTRRPMEARFPCPVGLGVQKEKVPRNGRTGG